MDSENQQKPKLDDDILQCKADLKAALQAANRTPVDFLPPKEQPSQTTEALQPLNSAQTKPKSRLEESTDQEYPESPVGIRILSFEAIQKEKNEPLPVPVAAPLQTQSDDLQLRIGIVERELAETIGQLSVAKQQIEKKEAALALKARQLRQAADEKEATQKSLEALAVERAQAFDALKVVQKAAAQTLRERQSEIEALKEKLTEAKARLEEADIANALLTREKMELTEATQDARIQEDWERTLLKFEIEEANAESSEEQLPEPCGEEVISEDDIHIEQRLAPDEIPSFNLAEQIMAEQRKAVAARRRPPESSGKPAGNGSIEHVMQHYVSNVNISKPPVDAAATPSPVERTERFLRWQGESLSEYQESLLGTIIQKDIQRFCGIGLPSLSMRPSGHRPMDN